MSVKAVVIVKGVVGIKTLLAAVWEEVLAECMIPILLTPVVDLICTKVLVLVQVVELYLSWIPPKVIKEFVAELVSILKDLKLVVNELCTTTFPLASIPKGDVLEVGGVALLILVNFKPEVLAVPEDISTLAVGFEVPIPTYPVLGFILKRSFKVDPVEFPI